MSQKCNRFYQIGFLKTQLSTKIRLNREKWLSFSDSAMKNCPKSFGKIDRLGQNLNSTSHFTFCTNNHYIPLFNKPTTIFNHILIEKSNIFSDLSVPNITKGISKFNNSFIF